VIENIVREIQQDNVGHMFEVDYLLWLTLTMRALLFQYSSSEDSFTVEGSSKIFQPHFMISVDWQEVIQLLWMSFKSQLFYTKQYEYMLAVSKYKLVKQRPFTLKHVEKKDAAVKQKVPAVKKDKKTRLHHQRMMQIKRVQSLSF
jgi:hypothetical protein